MNTWFRILVLASLLVILVGCDATTSTVPPPPPEPVDPTAWMPVTTVPPTIVDAITTEGAIAYAASLNRVFLSTNRGDSWREVTPLPPQVTVVSLALMNGRLFAGTLGDGVYESSDQGQTWTPRNDGLSSQSERRVLALSVRGDRLYAGTDGAGVLVYRLTALSTWTPFRTGMPANLSWNVGDIVRSGARLVVGAGGNGMAYVNDEGATSWREVSYDAEFPGSLRLVFDAEVVADGAQPIVLLGTTSGLYRSVDRGETWVRANVGTGAPGNVALAQRDDTLFAAVVNPSRGTSLFASDDAGETWRRVVDLPGVFVADLKVVGDRLYAGRFDGLWALPISATREAS